MLKTLLDVVLQVCIAVARIVIMVVVAALTLAGRLLATAVGFLWRRNHSATPGAATPESPFPILPTPAPKPRARPSRPRPFKL